MTEKKKKNYPMDGPPRHIQVLMQHPKRNRKELKEWYKANKNMRVETLQAAGLK